MTGTENKNEDYIGFYSHLDKKLVIEGQFTYSSLMELPYKIIGLFNEPNSHKDIRLVKFSMDLTLVVTIG